MNVKSWTYSENESNPMHTAHTLANIDKIGNVIEFSNSLQA